MGSGLGPAVRRVGDGREPLSLLGNTFEKPGDEIYCVTLMLLVSGFLPSKYTFYLAPPVLPAAPHPRPGAGAAPVSPGRGGQSAVHPAVTRAQPDREPTGPWRQEGRRGGRGGAELHVGTVGEPRGPRRSRSHPVGWR